MVFKLKPRKTHLLVLICGAVIVIFEMFIYLEKEYNRQFSHITGSQDQRRSILLNNDGVRLDNEHDKDMQQMTLIDQRLNRIESTYNVTDKVEPVSENSENQVQSIVKDAIEETGETVPIIEDENNEFDVTSLDEQITLNHVPEKSKKVTDKKVEKHLDPLAMRRQFKWNGDYEQKLNISEQVGKDIKIAFYRPPSLYSNVDCPALMRHDKDELSKARAIMRQVGRRGIPVEKYAHTVDCENFRGGRGYIEHPLSQIELEFPLAFGLIIYRDVEQAERLIRSIYRPHNVYCIHMDMKMKPIERTAIERVAGCLDNVFVAETSINVTWGEFSVLEAELICMRSLIKYKHWKYYINLTGQEFPLKTNKEIVSIIKSLQGANIVDGTWIRAKEKYFYRWTQAGHPPPHKIRPIKGSVHVGVNRQFVEFALYDQRARDFLEWLKKTQIPDETFFASLNHNPFLGINGSFLGEAEEYPLKPSLMRYKNWELGHSVFVRKCEGKYVRNICVLGVGDLNQAFSDIGLFVNKFNLDFEYLALDCLENVLYEKTWTQFINDEDIDISYYQHLDYVKKKLVVR